MLVILCVLGGCLSWNLQLHAANRLRLAKWHLVLARREPRTPVDCDGPSISMSALLNILQILHGLRNLADRVVRARSFDAEIAAVAAFVERRQDRRKIGHAAAQGDFFTTPAGQVSHAVFRVDVSNRLS